MCPEQLAGRPVDARSDLYSAAMVIHEALTGHLPYVTGKTFAELCPEAPPSLSQILEQCLKPNPNERPASAVEVYLRLQELGKASGILLLPPGAMEKLLSTQQQQQRVHEQPTLPYMPAGGGRRVWLWRGLVLAALAAAAGLTVYGLMTWLQ
jgi:serine/threonine-protein kinase